MNATNPQVFVYNGDSGLFHTLGDIGHKLFSPATYPCRLCAITYGVLSERAPWRAFVESLGLPCEFLHRDQFRDRYPGVAVPLPAVFRLVDGQPRVCVEAATLAACSGFADLDALIRRNCTGSLDLDGEGRE